MDIVHPDVDKYLDERLAPPELVLREMQDHGETHRFPIVGAQVGRLLYVLARSISAQRVLELGSGFGYSAMWFAMAVGPKGRVVLTDPSRDNATRARSYFERAGMIDRIEIEVGNGLEMIRRLPGQFDVIFNDIDKTDYPKTLELVRPKLRRGGLFISDNMLWHGAVVTGSRAADVRGVKRLTQLLLDAPDFVTTILPVRDGVAVALKVR